MKKTIIIVIFLMASSISHADTETIDGYTWTYRISDDIAEIYGVYDQSSNSYAPSISPMPVGFVTIPSMLGGKRVAAIGHEAFCNCSGLTGIAIPNSVTSIGAEAFIRCSGLLNVTIPNSVTNIGISAFLGCSGLTSFTIPNSVSNINAQTFCDCSGLMNLTIPESIKSIGDSAFAGCSGLTEVTIPNSVTGIADGVFCECIGLMSLTIPESVTSIGSHIFQGCYNLRTVIFLGSCPANVSDDIYKNLWSSSTFVSRYSSGWDDSLATGTWKGRPIVLMDVKDDIPPSDCTVNGDGTLAFKYAGRDVDEIFVPARLGGRIVSVISMDAFSSCSGLKSITIPATVTLIDDESFALCSSLTSVTYLGDAPDTGINIYRGTPRSLVTHVMNGSIGWSEDFSDRLPSSWNGRRIAYVSDSGSGGSGSSGGGSSGEETTASAQVVLTVTNVVVHYVLNSVVPEIAVPVSGDTGFVTVVTEIKGGAVAVAESWATNYPGFTEKFGSDFSAALTKLSGKRDSQGNALMVWQDYVSGTDPTDENDVFKASITLVDGVPQVSYTPELPEAETAKRKYTTYGKARLQDEEWSVVDGDAANYNFFKVTVEMR